MTKQLYGTKNKIHVTAVLSLLVVALFAYAMPASAATTVNAPQAATDAGAGLNNQTISSIVITSGVAGDISTGGILITLPTGSGLTFNPTGTIQAVVSGVAGLVVGTPVVSSGSLITIPVTTASAAGSILTVSNIRVDVADTSGAKNVTVQTAGGTNTTDVVVIVKPTLDQTNPISLRAGGNGQDPLSTVTIRTNNFLGQIGAGTSINLVLPASSGVTFDASSPGTVSDNLNPGVITAASKNATVSPDGLTLSVSADGPSGFADIVTFTGFKLNAAGTASTTNFSATTTTANGKLVSLLDTSGNFITIIKPTLTVAAVTNLAAGGMGQAGANVIVSTPAIAGVPAGLIGNGTAIMLTLPNTGVTFNKSANVTVSSVPATVIAAPKIIKSADGLTLTVTADANSTLNGGDVITFSGISLNATATAASAVNYTLTTSSFGGVAVTSTTGATDIMVFMPTVTGNTTIPLDLDGIVMFPGNNTVITTPVAAGQIGTNTTISITLPGTGVTFDTSATVSVSSTGAVITGARNATVTQTTLSILTNGTSVANEIVTFSGIRYNATTGAATATLAVTTTASGAGAQPVTNSTQKVTILPLTADTITNRSASDTQAAGSTATYSWNVTNATFAATTGGFGGQAVDFTTTAGTLNVLSAVTNSSGIVSVQLTTTTGAALKATIRGTAINNTINVVVPAGPATKLAIFPDVAKVAGIGAATITVKAQDQFGNNNTTVPPIIVHLIVTGIDTIFLNPAGNHNATVDGTVTFTIRKANPGTTDLTALDTVAPPGIPLTQATGTQLFVADIGGILLSGPASLSATGQVAALTAQLRDAAGVNLALPGQTVTFSSNNTTLAAVGIPSAVTNATGVATSNVTANALGLTGTVMINASVTNAAGTQTFTSTLIVILVTPGFINGTVTNNTSLAPIAGATVTAGGLTATTDATGFYSISIAPGTYTVNASAANFTAQSVPGVVVLSGATTIQNFALVPVAARAALPPEVAPFDTNGNRFIERGEAVACVVQFFTAVPAAIPRTTAVSVVVTFFTQPPL